VVGSSDLYCLRLTIGSDQYASPWYSGKPGKLDSKRCRFQRFIQPQDKVVDGLTLGTAPSPIVLDSRRQTATLRSWIPWTREVPAVPASARCRAR
jgi:hypothetical protein